MSDQDILSLAERCSKAYRSPTSNYTADDVYILTPEELIEFACEICNFINQETV